MNKYVTSNLFKYLKPHCLHERVCLVTIILLRMEIESFKLYLVEYNYSCLYLNQFGRIIATAKNHFLF